MNRTGIFFTYFQGQRLRDFPQALEGLLSRDNVLYYDAVYDATNGLFYLQPVTERLLLEVHSREMARKVMSTDDYEAALYSAGGTMHAACEIWKGVIDNAFVFTSFGDHHAGRDFFGGMCYFNGAALAIADLRSRGVTKFAIVDTDAHHADGTRDIFREDIEVLHVCFCWQDYADACNNVDIAIPHHTSDQHYLEQVEKEFVPRAKEFRPEIIFWELGYDATRGEYGDKGLTPHVHVSLAELLRQTADKVCRGRLITILCGGSRRDLARYIIPKVIDVLSGGSG
ncbi:hypothetical protein ACFLVD_00210 [Chloroflexota bacterium]